MDGKVIKLKFNPEVDFCPGCGTLLPRLVPGLGGGCHTVWLVPNKCHRMDYLMTSRPETLFQTNIKFQLGGSWRCEMPGV